MLEWLFSWGVVSVGIGLLITIGLGVLPFNDFRLAKLFFFLAAADAVGGIAMFGVKARLPFWADASLIFVLCGSVGVLLFLSLTYVNSKQQAKGKNRPGENPPFSVGVTSVLFSPASDVPTPIWVVFGPSKASVSALANFRLVNLQDVPAKIDRFTVEVNTSRGWAKVARPDSRTFRIFWVADGTKFSQAVEMRPSMIDARLAENSIAPHETVEGWLALFYPRLNPPEKLDTKYRVTVADTAGSSCTIETASTAIGDLGGSSIAVTGRVDISGYATRLIQDISSYWKH